MTGPGSSTGVDEIFGSYNRYTPTGYLQFNYSDATVVTKIELNLNDLFDTYTGDLFVNAINSIDNDIRGKFYVVSASSGLLTVYNVIADAELFSLNNFIKIFVSYESGYTGIFDDSIVDVIFVPTSSRGYTGSRSYTGSQGAQGNLGYHGSKGFIGSQGFTGSRSYAGSQGIQGNLGFTGSIGFTGSSGFIGSRGIQGYFGSEGYTGSKGLTGLTYFDLLMDFNNPDTYVTDGTTVQLASSVSFLSSSGFGNVAIFNAQSVAANRTIKTAAKKYLFGYETIVFAYNMAGGGAGWGEIPDTNENLSLEYSIDGVTNWTSIIIFPVISTTPNIWTQYKATIPSGAKDYRGVHLRFNQPQYSGGVFDNFSKSKVSSSILDI
jgi:hypothetical protein